MIDVSAYIKKQLALWEAQEQREKSRQRQGRGSAGDISYGPYVLISREKGAGGQTVAELVGGRLGWQVYDREIVDEIAKTTNVQRALVESLDEQYRGAIEDIIMAMFNQEHIDATRYEYLLRQVVLTLGHRGRVVIVGRGGGFILPSQFGLRVRLIAPLKTRIQRIAAEQELTFKVAQAKVNKSDLDRARLAERDFQHDINDPLLQDLIINTEEMSTKATAETILTALRQKLGVAPKREVGKS